MHEGIPQSLARPEVRKRSGVINCASYAQGIRVANVELADISEELKHEDRFVWVGLFEPDEKLLREIQEQLGLHDLAIEDAHCAHQRPKLEHMRIVSLSCCGRYTSPVSRSMSSLERRTSLWGSVSSFPSDMARCGRTQTCEHVARLRHLLAKGPGLSSTP